MRVGRHAVSSPVARASAPAVVASLLVAAFLVVVALGVRDATQVARQLGDRRAEAIATRSDQSGLAGRAAGSFRALRGHLEPGSRFALVYDEDYDRNERGYYRLVAGYYLYPALMVSDPARADAVITFGAPPAHVLQRFDQLAVIDGFWVGTRKPG
jgi:hypothetical protein